MRHPRSAQEIVAFFLFLLAAAWIAANAGKKAR
jgi:hypothetical protein